MANRRHLAILKKGKQAWDEWRKRKPDVAPNLREANLREANLRGADLSDTDLRKANLREAKLRGADLVDAALDGADLSAAELSEAFLNRAFLSGADLHGAGLRGADLSGADLVDANLDGANLQGAHLNEANLSGANLCRANLVEASLGYADLSGAYLSGAYLVEANLVAADLSRADLQDVDLRYGQLSECNLTRAKLTGARLYATARDDWIIEGVECKYVFWDDDGRQRYPEDKDFESGEFEDRYKRLPSFDYFFENGFTPFDPVIMDRVVQEIRENVPAAHLDIDLISPRGHAPFIRFTVATPQFIDELSPRVKEGYARYVEHLECEIDWLRRQLADGREASRLLLEGAIQRVGHRVDVQPGGIAVVDSQNVTIPTFQERAGELREIVQQAPARSRRRQQAKSKLLNILDGAITGIAKDQLKKAAEQIIELGKDLGPVILKTAAYAFFKNMMPGG